MKFKLYQGDCLERLAQLDRVKCIFADPPDNIGLGYDTYTDKKADAEYEQLLFKWIEVFVAKADIVWLSFNAKWTATVGAIVRSMLGDHNPFELEFKPCVQVFTFGQHRNSDLGNNHRPLWRLMRKGAPLYPEAIKVPSWRERNGDKRAKPGGRVPGDVFDFQYVTTTSQQMGKSEVAVNHALAMAAIQAGDVFDFPRVTGNSAQRCDWHPTQLHEELVERCIKLSTNETDRVVDPFGGTGTTLRVCIKLDRPCSIIELDKGYCDKIAKLNGLKVCRSPGVWGK
jgi:DNA modification methylase